MSTNDWIFEHSYFFERNKNYHHPATETFEPLFLAKLDFEMQQEQEQEHSYAPKSNN